MECLANMREDAKEKTAETLVKNMTDMMKELAERHVCPSCALFLMTLTLCQTMEEFSGLDTEDIVTVMVGAMGTAFKDEISVSTLPTDRVI